MRSHASLLAPVLLMASLSARAEEPGFYVGLSLGQAEQSIDSGGGILVTSVPGGGLQQLLPTTTTVDDEDLAINATLGYRVNQYFAAELSYVDLGEAEVTETFTFTLIPGMLTPATFDRNFTSKTAGPAVSVLGSYPLTPSLSISLRAGVLFADQELDIGGQDLTFGDEVWLAGAGASYSFAERWTARLEYQRSDDLDATIVSGETRLEQWLLTVLFRL